MGVYGSFADGESSGSCGESSKISGDSGGSGRCEDREIMIRDDNIITAFICFFWFCYGVAEIFVEE